MIALNFTSRENLAYTSLTFKTIKFLNFTLGCYSIFILGYCGRKFMVLIDYLQCMKTINYFPCFIVRLELTNISLTLIRKEFNFQN